MLRKSTQVMNLSIFINSDDDVLKQLYKEAAIMHNEKMCNNPFPDAGFDLFAPFRIQCDCDNVNKINFQVRCSATMSYEAYSYNTGYYLYPRSSLSKTTLRLANSVGIIDSGYRGDLIGVFDCIRSASTIHPYDKLIQICAPGLVPIMVTIVDNLDELGCQTDRGDGGFGSTDKK